MKIEDIVIADIYEKVDKNTEVCVIKDVLFVKYTLKDRTYYKPLPLFRGLIDFMNYKDAYNSSHDGIKDLCTEYFKDVVPDEKSQSVIWRKEKFTTRWDEFCSLIFDTEIRGDWANYFPYFIKDVKELKNEVARGNVHCVKDTATKVSYSTIKKIQGEYGHKFKDLRDEINENVLYGKK